MSDHELRIEGKILSLISERILDSDGGGAFRRNVRIFVIPEHLGALFAGRFKPLKVRERREK
jgi:hypothetical protein